jgi:peptide/nickel transport system permease protein
MNVKVADLVRRAVLWTIILEAASLAIAILIAVPIGILAAVKQGSKTDHVARFFGIFFWSIPWFWYGALMILFFSLYMPIFPAGGAYSTTDAEAIFGKGTILDVLWHLVLPAIVLGTNYAGFLSRIVRSSMLEILRQEYILTARSKGLKERIVIYKHAFRNALLPVITVIGLYLGSMLSGAAVVETVFSWPGMGRLIVESSYTRDYPTIMGCVVTTSTVMVFAILVTDIMYAFIDPRIRY